MTIEVLNAKDQEMADEMFENLKYLLTKYEWLAVYHCAWRTMANKMCRNVDASCQKISDIKRAKYKELRQG